LKYDAAHIERVQDMPHWRIVINPGRYDPERISTLSKCWQVMEKRRLVLRGWDYPHLDNHDGGRGNGANWIASGCAWGGHNEYWKFFQSGQFVHLLGLYEGADPHRASKAMRATETMLSAGHATDTLKGYVDIVSLLYTVTEVHTFAAGLVAEGIFDDSVKVEIQLVNAADFILTADRLRVWPLFCRNTENPLGKEWIYPTQALLASAGPKALEATVRFLESFGWNDPNIEQLQRDQEKFLRGEF